MNRDRTVTATFEINTYALDVSVVGSGSVARTPDLVSYEHGTIVNLEATPTSGRHFVGWSGAITGSTNPVDLVMDGAKSVVATFEINTYTLDVTTEGEGNVSKMPDQASYEHGASVTLTAVADNGWSFQSWSGAVTDTTNPIEFVMDANKSITASFLINTYTLTVIAEGPGMVTKSPDQSIYDYGTEVTLTATPEPGFAFGFWEGDASGNANPLIVSVDSTMSIMAVFGITSVGNPPVTEFALTSIAPNPSSEATRIEFTAPREGRVRLSIFDLQGREIAVLVEDILQAGRHRRVWNGIAGERTAPAGVYFVRYRTPGRDYIRRLAISR